MTSLPRRRWLLGATALPAALVLGGCGGLPLLGAHRGPGTCLPPSEDIPEEEQKAVPEGIRPHPARPDPRARFLSSGFALSPDGSLLAAFESSDRRRLDLADDDGLILWDTSSGEVLRRIAAPARGAIAWHPDGAQLAIADARHISILDIDVDARSGDEAADELRWNLIGHELPRNRIANVLDVAYSPDGTQLASTGNDRTVRLWDLEGEECGSGHILVPARRSEARVSYSPDGSVLAVGATAEWTEGDSDNPPELWDPATGAGRTVLRDVEGIVFELGHSGDGTLVVLTYAPDALLAIGPDGGISEGPVTGSTWYAELAVGPGSKVAVHGDDELLIWDRATDESQRLEVAGVERMCWSPDESTLFTLDREEGVAAWDGQSWRRFELP